MENRLKPIQSICTDSDLENLIWGGAFLGSGGGGPINLAHSIKTEILKLKQSIPVLQTTDVGKITRPTYGAVVALMGSPEAASQGIDMSSSSNAFSALEEVTPNNKLDYSLFIEIGAVNSLVPLYVAAKKKIAVVDGDGAGRAVPKIQNTTYAVNTSISPSAISNGPRPGDPTIDNIVNMRDVPQAEMADTLESYALGILANPSFGSLAGLATYVLHGNDIDAASVPQTLTLTYYLGERIKNAVAKGQDPVPAVTDFLSIMGIQHYTFGYATVVEVNKPGSGTLDVGSVKIHDKVGNELVLQYENENLFATLNNDIWAMAPDSICYIGRMGSMSNVEVAKGQEVTIIGIPANERIRQPEIVQSFMDELKALNIYDGNYIPIENIHD